MPEKISAVGFDLDGTLYSITPEIKKRQRFRIYERIAEEFAVSVESAEKLFEETYSVIGSGTKTIEVIAKNLRKPIPSGDFVQEALESADFLDLMRPNEELSKMLRRISQTRRLDVLTGSRYDFTLRKLDRIGINLGLFQSIFAGEDGHKITGEIYLKWLNQTRLPPSQHLYVGDNGKIDIDAPNRLGIKTCIVGSYEPADFQIGNILELERILM